MAERDVAEEQHHFLWRDLAAGGAAERADQQHRQHDGEDHDQRRAEVARQFSAQSGIE